MGAWEGIPVKLTEMALFTSRVDEVSAFYEKLLNVAPVQREPGTKAVFDVNGFTLLVHERGDDAMPGYPPDEDHAAYATSDLAATCDDLVKRGFRFEAGPREYPWGTSAYLRDPDGRLVEIHQAP